MKFRKPRSIESMNKVWEKLMEYADRNPENTKYISQSFNEMLDMLCGDDFFGTECQCDPRGDHRD